jgi:hypothetical protein
MKHASVVVAEATVFSGSDAAATPQSLRNRAFSGAAAVLHRNLKSFEVSSSVAADSPNPNNPLICGASEAVIHRDDHVDGVDHESDLDLLDGTVRRHRTK